MRALFGYADEYIRRSDWKVIAALKFCLCAMGMMIGIAVPEKAKKPMAFTAMAVFIATYIPLALKLLEIIEAKKQGYKQFSTVNPNQEKWRGLIHENEMAGASENH